MTEEPERAAAGRASASGEKDKRERDLNFSDGTLGALRPSGLALAAQTIWSILRSASGPRDRGRACPRLLPGREQQTGPSAIGFEDLRKDLLALGPKRDGAQRFELSEDAGSRVHEALRLLGQGLDIQSTLGRSRELHQGSEERVNLSHTPDSITFRNASTSSETTFCAASTG